MKTVNSRLKIVNCRDSVTVDPFNYLLKRFNKVDIFTAIEVALKNFAKRNSGKSNGEDQQTYDNHISTKESIFIRDN